MKRAGWIAVLVLAAACGEKEKSQQQAPAQQQQETRKPDPVEEQKKAEARQARIDELTRKERELRAQVDEQAKALEELARTHEKEEAELPDPTRFRRMVQQAIKDSAKATSLYASDQKRYDELKKLAESEVTGELKELRTKKDEVDQRYQDALSGWRDAIDKAASGAVEASPVKVELDTIRAAKKRWFEATPVARRGEAGASEKKIINDAFRAWLKEEQVRWLVVEKVLAQPEAQKGKTPDNYDYTDLDFYILLELLENVLDKQNVAVENKKLAEEEKRVEAILEESERLREAIAQKMVEGGDELSEFEDISSRLEARRQKADDLQRRVTDWRDVLAEIRGARDRHLEEQEGLRVSLEKDRKELLAVRAELRRLG